RIRRRRRSDPAERARVDRRPAESVGGGGGDRRESDRRREHERCDRETRRREDAGDRFGGTPGVARVQRCAYSFLERIAGIISSRLVQRGIARRDAAENRRVRQVASGGEVDYGRRMGVWVVPGSSAADQRRYRQNGFGSASV